MSKKIKMITSFFYLGHSPFMPGTVGSLAGLVVYYLVKDRELLYAFTLIFLFGLGVLFAGQAEKIYKRKDPSMIVIDEAMAIVLDPDVVLHRERHRRPRVRLELGTVDEKIRLRDGLRRQRSQLGHADAHGDCQARERLCRWRSSIRRARVRA